MLTDKFKVFEFSTTEFFVETENGNYIVYKFPFWATKILPFEGNYQDASDFLESKHSSVVPVQNLPQFLGTKVEFGITITV